MTISNLSANADTLYVSPNPFDSITTIHFDIVQNDTVSLYVYDMLGHIVKTYFQDTFLTSGSYSINFIADTLPNGIYLVILNTTTNTLIAKVVIGFVGISENEIEKQKSIIYPNPTTGKITIKAEDIEKIEIMDMQGRTVYIGSEMEIDISNNPKGIYIVKGTTNKGVGVEKIVLE